MTDVLLAAIHNGELPTSPAQGLIDAMGDVVTLFEVSDQPPLRSDVDRQELARWADKQWELEARWRRYLGRDSSLRTLKARLGKKFWHVRHALNSRRMHETWRSRQIENFVASKHIIAWRHFLSSTSSVLVVLESDATLLAETRAELLRFLKGVDRAQPVYINLAGGLESSALGIADLRVAFDHGAWRYERAVSNTSCAYLVTRPMAELLLNHLADNPSDAVLGIDWIFNGVFLANALAVPPIACFHADPPVVGHGSRLGLTQSWHPHR